MELHYSGLLLQFVGQRGATRLVWWGGGWGGPCWTQEGVVSNTDDVHGCDSLWRQSTFPFCLFGLVPAKVLAQVQENHLATAGLTERQEKMFFFFLPKPLDLHPPTIGMQHSLFYCGCMLWWKK